MAEKKKARKKITTEKNRPIEEVIEDKAIKSYLPKHYFQALQDLSIEVNNAYFRLSFIRCPECNKKSNSAIMAHFGMNKKNTIGNLKGFSATIGDIISWFSDTYRGVSRVVGKSNGVYELEDVEFDIPRKEIAVIEKIIIPSKYLPIIEEMAMFLSYPFVSDENELAKIGNGEYPSVIKSKL